MSVPPEPETRIDPLETRLVRARTEARGRIERRAAERAADREALLCDEILSLRAELVRLRAEIEGLRAARPRWLTGALRRLGRG